MGMVVRCGGCGLLLHESEKAEFDEALKRKLFPCKACGAENGEISATFTETVAVRDSVRYVGKAAGMRKPVIEGRAGADLYRETKEWRDVTRQIDRSKNRRPEAWYEERIVNEKGDVVREVSEPLKDHKGRGSARKRRGKKEEDSSD